MFAYRKAYDDDGMFIPFHVAPQRIDGKPAITIGKEQFLGDILEKEGSYQAG
jgi:hypothetical protein